MVPIEEGRTEVGFVDQAAPAGIDEQGGGFHPGQGLCPDEGFIFSGKRGREASKHHFRPEGCCDRHTSRRLEGARCVLRRWARTRMPKPRPMRATAWPILPNP